MFQRLYENKDIVILSFCHTHGHPEYYLSMKSKSKYIYFPRFSYESIRYMCLELPNTREMSQQCQSCKCTSNMTDSCFPSPVVSIFTMGLIYYSRACTKWPLFVHFKQIFQGFQVSVIPIMCMIESSEQIPKQSSSLLLFHQVLLNEQLISSHQYLRYFP